jgi:hypothetical protein
MNVEELANHVSDMDLSWSPFLFLRPEQHERLTSGRCFVLAALYGTMGGAAIDAYMAFAARTTGATLPSPLLFPLALVLGFFVVYRLTFAVAWNMRADRLVGAGGAGSERMRAWRALLSEQDEPEVDE